MTVTPTFARPRTMGERLLECAPYASLILALEDYVWVGDINSWWNLAFMIPAAILAVLATEHLAAVRSRRDRYRQALAQIAYQVMANRLAGRAEGDPLTYVPADVVDEAQRAAVKRHDESAELPVEGGETNG